MRGAIRFDRVKSGKIRFKVLQFLTEHVARSARERVR